MTNELLQELDAAGFWKDSQRMHPSTPSLVELIAACGKRFGILGKGIETEWIAETHLFDHGNKNGYGATPEEAVARLYIALNG